MPTTPQPDPLGARFEAIRRAMAAVAANRPTPEQIAEWNTADREMAQRIRAALPGVPLHHAYAVLRALRVTQRLETVAVVSSAPADRPASTAPLAAGFPLVQGRCPACQRASLFLGSGGYVTCSSADCPEPDAATTVLEQYADEAHAPEHTWKVESPRCGQWAHWFGPYDDHDWVRERYQDAVEVAPGREFRIVRATTTYTVEQPAAVSQPGKEATS